MRTLLLTLTLLSTSLFALVAGADEAPSLAVVTGEVGLEGQVQSTDNINGQITILATAFSTPVGRKAIAPPKLKTLRTTIKTRFYDEISGHDCGINDLETGLTVRCVGSDSGAGTPLEARLISCRLPKKTEPSDPDTPDALNGLLPPSQTINGVKVRVFNAGFETEKKLFTWGTKTRPTFFMAYRVIAPVDGDHYKAAWDWAQFKGITTPDGRTLRNSGQGTLGQNAASTALSFPDVDPRWQSVTAHWELSSPSAPTDANGEFRHIYEMKGEAPTPANPRVEPKTILQTPHGTICILESIVCDYEKQTTTLTVSKELPEEVPDVQVSTYQTGVRDDEGNRLRSSSSSRDNQFIIVCTGVPKPGTKNLTLGLEIDESAKSWRKKEFYHAVSLEIPVAALAKANPPLVTNQGTAPSYLAKNDVFTARLDETAAFSERWHGVLWLKPQTRPELAEKSVSNVFTINYGKATTTDGRSFNIGTYASDTDFFHNDGSLAQPDERAVSIQIDFKLPVPNDPVSLQIETVQTKQLMHILDSNEIPLPPLNKPTIFETPLGTGTLRLREIALVQGKDGDDIALRSGGVIRIPKEGAMVMVFNIDRAIPGSYLDTRSLQFRADDNLIEMWRISMWSGDALNGKKDGSLWTLAVSKPAEGSKQLKMHVEAREYLPSEPGPPIIVEGVSLKPTPEKRG